MAFPGLAFLPLLITLVILVSAGSLAAQAPPPRFEETVIVTAARSESTLDRAPAFVTVFDEARIAASTAQDLPGLLREAGIDVVDLTGNRRSHRVDLRGFGAAAGANTLMLVDGRRVNQPDLSGSDWSQIPLHQVARVEVVRGDGAVLFGGNATGGVVNILTRAGTTRGTRVSLRGGSFATFTPEIATSGRQGRVSYAASGRYHRSNGHRENAATEAGDVSGRLVVGSGGPFELGLSGGFHGDTTGLPGSLTEAALVDGRSREESLTPEDFAEVRDGYFMVTPRAAVGDQGHVLADISVRQRNSLFYSTFVGGEFSGDTGLRTVAVSPKIVLEGQAGPFRNHLVAGVDFLSADERIRNLLSFGGPADEGRFRLQQTGQAAYLRHEIAAGGLTVSGGYRYDRTEYAFEPGVSTRPTFDAHSGSLGAAVRLVPGVSVFGRASRSFRYPLLDELFDFFSSTISTTLEPQTSLDVEGGLRLEAGAARATLAAFRLTTDREILFNPFGGSGFGANENLDGRSRRMGVELAASVRLATFEVETTLAALEADVAGGRFDGRAMPGVAGRRATVGVRVPLSGRLSVGLQGVYTGSRFFEGDFDGRFGRQPAHTIVDAKATYATGRLRLFADVKNLLDRAYDEYGTIGGFPSQRAYYPSPGIHAVAGVELVW